MPPVCVLAMGGALAQSATAEQKAQIAPTGSLRVALVKIPFLAKQDAASGQLKGVAPDLGEELARRLGVPIERMPFDTPNAGIAALRNGTADITFLAPTPERVGLIDFGPAFMEMEMTLIVPASSPINSHADADQPGRKIVAYERTAVEEMARKKLTKATIVLVPIFGYKQAFELISPARPTPSPICATPCCRISRSFPARASFPATTGATRSPSATPRSGR